MTIVLLTSKCRTRCGEVGRQPLSFETWREALVQTSQEKQKVSKAEADAKSNKHSLIGLCLGLNVHFAQSSKYKFPRMIAQGPLLFGSDVLEARVSSCSQLIGLKNVEVGSVSWDNPYFRLYPIYNVCQSVPVNS